jgi:predicted Kef-type K+ transport protein
MVEFFSARQYQFTTDISKEKVQIRDKFARRCFFIAVSLRKKPQKSVKKPQNRCFPR